MNLTDPAAYEGGDVQLRDRLGNPIAIDGIRERGTVLVFPSNVAHSVTPVTSGVRNSLRRLVPGAAAAVAPHGRSCRTKLSGHSRIHAELRRGSKRFHE